MHRIAASAGEQVHAPFLLVLPARINSMYPQQLRQSLHQKVSPPNTLDGRSPPPFLLKSTPAERSAPWATLSSPS
jgi:hypothetical protein